VPRLLKSMRGGSEGGGGLLNKEKCPLKRGEGLLGFVGKYSMCVTHCT